MINTRTAPYAALLLRTSLGVIFIAHALLKILVFTPAGTVGFFASLGVPGWFAYPTMGVELIGGILLVAGIQTRVVSLALVPVLIGSIVLVHSGNGWLFSNANGGWEYPLFLTMAALVQASLGDGAYSMKTVSDRKETVSRSVAAAGT